MTYHLESLGWTLVHFCWQAAVVALAYRVVDMTLVDRRSHLRYVLALGALMSMFAISVATLGYEESRSRAAGFTETSMAPTDTTAGTQANLKWTASVGVTAAPTPGVTQLEFAPMLPYLDMIWLAGVVLLSVRLMGGWWLLRRLRHAIPIDVPAPVMVSMERMRKRIGITRKVVLRLSTEVTGPIAMGTFRALVLLPCSAITSLSTEELEVVLAHELAHIRRADYLWNMLQMVIETLFFFHPAVWWMGRCVREQRELSCDDIALEVCESPLVYATALLRLEEQRVSRLHLAMALDGSSKPGLRARIARILGDTNLPAPRQDLAPLSLIGLVAALLLFLLPMPQVFASLYPHVNGMNSLVSPTRPLTADPDSEMSSKDAPSPVNATDAVTNPTLSQTAAPDAAAASSKPAAGKVSTATAEDSQAAAEPVETPQAAPAGEGKHGGSDYIDAMRAAGYQVDLDEYVSMKVQGITPEYARTMAQLGYGKPSANELIGLKVQGVTPEYARQMADMGFGKHSIDDLIGMKVQGVTPDYARAMAQMDLGKPSTDDLIGMKVQGVTPEYVKSLRDAGIKPANFSDAIACRVQGVTPEYAKGIENAGFGRISTDELVGLRVQGVTPEYARSIKAQFPDASLNGLMQLRIFHIDDAFIASAKQHGFAPLTVDKLVKLRTTGLLDGVDDTRR